MAYLYPVTLIIQTLLNHLFNGLRRVGRINKSASHLPLLLTVDWIKSYPRPGLAPHYNHHINVINYNLHLIEKC